MDPRTLLEIDLERATEGVTGFIKEIVKGSDASAVVVGLSGGVDSSVVAALCVRALGAEKTLGVLIPADFTPKEDMADAREIAELLRISTETVNVQSATRAIHKCIGIGEDDSDLRLARANILARLRMMVLYYYANAKNSLVAGTGDKSEYLIGYFTKHGDGAADFFPIRHLYKSQVRKLALHLGLPQKVALKPSSPQLYPGHKLFDELPLDYDRLDPVLKGLYDLGMKPSEVAEATNTLLEVVKEIQQRHERSQHKRLTAPSLLQQDVLKKTPRRQEP